MQLSREEKKYLLQLARKSIQTALAGDDAEPASPPKDLPSPTLLERAGCFVSLHEKGELRGCIGTLEPVEQLWLGVFKNARLAAFNDYRFEPVSASELPFIEIEISVLTPPKPLSYSSPQDLLEKLVPLKHGVILKKGGFSATFLPQVWEQLPDKKEFLAHLSLKAGLPPNAWENAQVFVYEALVFSEKEFNLP